MYKKHRVMLVLVILLFGAISYLFSVDYADIIVAQLSRQKSEIFIMN